MPFAEAMTTLQSTIDPRDDPKFIPETHGLRIASHQNAFLWNQRHSCKLLITLADESAGHFRLQIADLRLKKS
jgi:hypothetical protein